MPHQTITWATSYFFLAVRCLIRPARAQTKVGMENLHHNCGDVNLTRQAASYFLLEVRCFIEPASTHTHTKFTVNPPTKVGMESLRHGLDGDTNLN